MAVNVLIILAEKQTKDSDVSRVSLGATVSSLHFTSLVSATTNPLYHG